MNNLFIESGHTSICKHSETICGDCFEILKNRDKITIVLSDGLGSGVKANILSTLTSKILSTMTANNLPIDECVETVANTLPMCRERKLAYATFTVFQIEDNNAYLVQYDNPHAIILRNGKNLKYSDSVHFFGEKEIHESHIRLEQDDIIILMTDGVTNAGMGKTSGWTRDDVIMLAESWYDKDMSPQRLSAVIAGACIDLGQGEVDDDTTVLVFKLRQRQAVNVIIGPPEHREDDEKVLRLFFSKEGKHIVCGGTTANTVSRYLGKPVVPVENSGNENVPSIAKIDGVDLVTEGIITLQKVVELAEKYAKDSSVSLELKEKKDGVSLLAEMLFEQATDINIFFGNAVNHAHDSLDIDFSTKISLVRRLEEYLTGMGKNMKLSIC